MDVGATNIKVVNQTEITATITLPACEPTGSGGLWVINDYEQGGGYPVQIVGSPAPTITEVKPSTWFAGKTYDKVVINGTGFTKATADCPATPVNITTTDGSVVTVSGVTVDSKTKITLSAVSPAASTPTETPTVTVGTAPNTAPAAVQILGNQIQCDPSMNCTQPVISTTDGSAPPVQNVVVGQPIILTTNPNLPATITPLKPTWAVGGTNIGWYSPTPASYDTASVTKTELKESDLNTYWVYPGTAIPVTYQYCVDIPGASPVKQCSMLANASFNVTGPGDAQMTIDAYNALTISKIVDHWPCLPPDWNPYLQYGVVTGYDDKACPDSGGVIANPVGIKFTQPEDSSNGTYSFVQLITGDKTTYASGKSSGAYITTPGMDGARGYPYPRLNLDDAYVSDSPNSPLVGPTNYSKSSRTLAATMYLLWTSNIQNSIPVPIGYQKWHFKSSTTNSGYPTSQSWNTPVSQYVGTDGDVIPSATDPKSQTSPYGYPIWRNLATPVWSITNANEVDQEEEL